MVTRLKRTSVDRSEPSILCRSVKVPFFVFLPLVFIYVFLQARFIAKLMNEASSTMPRGDSPTTTKINVSYKDTIKEYVPSSFEKYIIDNAERLGYASEKVGTASEPWLNLASGCAIWNDPELTNKEIHSSLQSYQKDLEKYNVAMENFQPIPDIFDEIIKGNYDACSSAKVHPNGLTGLFPSNQLSLTKSGYIEPLTPPMRSYKGMCTTGQVMDLDYLVHDFEAMCRNLKPTSRRVFIDLGASLDHGTGKGWMAVGGV